MPSSMQLVLEASNKLLAASKVTNVRGCLIDMDRHVQRNVLIMRGSVSETSVRVPREDRPLSSLRLHDSLLVAQLCLDALEHFALEVVVSHSGPRRTKVVIGTHIKTARFDDNIESFAVACLPLIIPRNKWVQVLFHLEGIVRSVFSLPAFTCMDSVTVTGCGRLCAIYACSDEQACIDATPDSMALFAVPAYAPPIWKSAEPAADCGMSLPSLEAASSAAAVAEAHLPARASQCSASLSPSPPPPLSTRPPAMPSRLHPLVASPSPQETLQRPTMSARAGSAAGYTRCDYIRLVDDSGPGADDACASGLLTSEAYQQPGGQEAGGRRGPASGVRGGYESPRGGGGAFGGWEQPADERKAENASPASGRAAKAELQRRPPRRPNAGPSASSGAESERVQRLVAARKRQVSPRLAGSGGGAAPRGRSTGSRRQQRLRRRLRVLRANEQKVNTAAAAKTLLASELPLAKRVEAPADALASGLGSPADAPICGFGFGYLGVLKSNGAYEEDEDANLNLRGALTLNSDDE